MNTTTSSQEQASRKTKASAARKAAGKLHSTKVSAPKEVRKRKPSMSELIVGMRKFEWDFEAMKRV